MVDDMSPSGFGGNNMKEDTLSKIEDPYSNEYKQFKLSYKIVKGSDSKSSVLANLEKLYKLIQVELHVDPSELERFREVMTNIKNKSPCPNRYMYSVIAFGLYLYIHTQKSKLKVSS